MKSKKKDDIPPLVPDAAAGQPDSENVTEATETAGNSEETVQDTLVGAFDELKDRYMRLAAEYDNFRKRSRSERETVFADAFTSAVAAFLPVVDNIDRAAAQPCTDEGYKKGVELICKQFTEVFDKLGIKGLPGVGEPFDPNLHDAVMHVQDESVGENTVVEVMQKGYSIGERVIRHSVVKVAN